MLQRIGMFLIALVVSCGVAIAGDVGGNVTAAARDLVFENDVRPILKTHCFQCHGEGEKLKGGLNLLLRRLMVEGGDTGAAIVPGKGNESLLVSLVLEKKMPRGERKLTDTEIEIIRKWIDQGAKTASPEPERLGSGYLMTEVERNFWSFQPIKKPRVPDLLTGDIAKRVRTDIDRFIASRLASDELAFSEDTEKESLIRRATFDLIGLPPTPGEVDAFVADVKPGAYSRMLDRLLASPRYGERWGRHWLDVAGYADSEGYTDEDAVRPHAWRYRDYVIRAFNEDKPFDQFIREQLAGDEMVTPPYRNLSKEDQSKLIATGFLRMAPDGTGSNPADASAARNQTIADTIEVISTSLLGMTVACARCHDHRYDPIPQTDFYQMRALLEPAYDWKNWRSPKQRLLSLYTDADRAEAKKVDAKAAKIDAHREKKQKEYIDQTFEKQLAKLPEGIRMTVRSARYTTAAKRTEEQKRLLAEHPSVNVSAGSLYLYDKKAADDLKKMADDAAKVRSTKPKEEFIRALTETPHAKQTPQTFLFARGDHDQPKQAVAPAVMAVLATRGDVPKLPEKDKASATTGRRLAYARWLTGGNHPLTARVIVNRIWSHHFGRGLVATLGDFGALGDRPTHPQLLDWLAHDFMANGWKVKRLHKLIMMSTVYRQASSQTSSHARAGVERDADNRLLWRMPMRRIDAESLRDSLLALSGKLNTEMYGPAVPVMEDSVGQIVIGKENKDGEGKPGKTIPMNGQEYRRSIYVQVRRSRTLGMLESFDAPVMSPNCIIRNTSTVAPQALMLMNGQFAIDQAALMAHRVRADAKEGIEEQVKWAWRLAYGQRPSLEDVDAALAFVKDQAELFDSLSASKGKGPGKEKVNPSDSEIQALARYCHALISSNRFLYVD